MDVQSPNPLTDVKSLFHNRTAIVLDPSRHRSSGTMWFTTRRPPTHSFKPVLAVLYMVSPMVPMVVERESDSAP